MLNERKVRTAPCIAGCGRQVPYKTNAKVVCDACFGERKREKDRRAAEKRRRKNGVAAVGDTQIQCARCDRLISRRGIKRRFCDECAPQAAVERSNAYQKVRRRRIGLPEFGTEQKCANCPETFLKEHPRQFYCSKCIELQKANKLPSLRASISIWRRKRYSSDPSFALNDLMRSGIYKSLGSGKAGRSWESLVGYTVEELMHHLERQFLPGMSWENRHLWQIDHRQPLASFSFITAEDPEFRAAWAITNLSPLWAKDNLEKRDRRLHLL